MRFLKEIIASINRGNFEVGDKVIVDSRQQFDIIYTSPYTDPTTLHTTPLPDDPYKITHISKTGRISVTATLNPERETRVTINNLTQFDLLRRLQPSDNQSGFMKV